MGQLRICPVTLKAASEFIRLHHRHHKPPVGHKFSVGLQNGSGLVGVATVGRPVARGLDDGYTVEVTRVCVIEGHRNACSMLYGAARRAAKAMGYTRVVTYILETENGASLRASGYTEVALTAGGAWDTPSRPRLPGLNETPKRRYEA